MVDMLGALVALCAAAHGIPFVRHNVLVDAALFILALMAEHMVFLALHTLCAMTTIAGISSIFLIQVV
jgi:hypothetical protein